MPAPLPTVRRGVSGKRGARSKRSLIIERIAQAEFIGWPALAESWRRDLAAFDAAVRDARSALEMALRLGEGGRC